MPPELPRLEPGQLLTDALGASVLALDRAPALAPPVLGPREQALFDAIPYPHRRAEWIAGRAAAKQLLSEAMQLDPARVEILPAPSDAPVAHLDGKPLDGVVLNISHTRRYAAAACARGPVGIDLCDLADAYRLERIARRVMSEGEPEACGAYRSDERSAAVWAIKEAVLKLRIGGVFQPGARSVRVTSIVPPATADAAVRLAAWSLPGAVLAIAR